MHSFLSRWEQECLEKNENKATGAKIRAPVLGQNFPKLAIVWPLLREKILAHIPLYV